YEAYLEAYKNETAISKEYLIEASAYTELKDMEVTTLMDYEGMEGESVLTDEKGLISYEIEVEESGLYNVSILYYPVEGKSSAIQRSIFVDGQLPFAELQNVEFDRIWQDRESTMMKDNQGNELKPNQIEKPEWIEEVISDYQGYYTKPYQIYLEKGSHVLSLLSRREPMLLRSIRLFQTSTIPTYEEIKKEYERLGYEKAKDVLRVIEAEDSLMKSFLFCQA
ncbi:MAG: ABC transporter substrate-binding protein, partial [Vallitaleaceae bacterium]|nr:ABC transporter substrate-binding protein [Vallitaleaceae bacterium]